VREGCECCSRRSNLHEGRRTRPFITSGPQRHHARSVIVRFMSIFHRRRRDAHANDALSELEEIESSPELRAAEASVNRLPPPPPSMNPFFDVVAGSRPRLVRFPEEEESPEQS
jgi:hypothetical protein